MLKYLREAINLIDEGDIDFEMSQVSGRERFIKSSLDVPLWGCLARVFAVGFYSKGQE